LESEAPRVLVETSLATSKITITPSSGLSASSAGGVTRYDNAPLEPTRGPSKKLRSRPRKLATKKDCDPASSTIIGDSIWQRVGDGLGMLPRSKLPTNSSDEALFWHYTFAMAKALTGEQAEGKKSQATRFMERIGQSDRADEFDQMSVDLSGVPQNTSPWECLMEPVFNY
jgi:hypothetical protein